MQEIEYIHKSGEIPESLQSVPFLHELDSPMVDQLLSEAVLLECNPGDIIICEGDFTQFFCILLRGAMDIVKDGKTVGSLSHAGEIVGELALTVGTARTASVVASRHSYCLKVEPAFIEELSESEHNAFFAKLYKFVSKVLSERLEESSKKIAQLEKKVAKLGGAVDKRKGEPDVYHL